MCSDIEFITLKQYLYDKKRELKFFINLLSIYSSLFFYLKLLV